MTIETTRTDSAPALENPPPSRIHTVKLADDSVKGDEVLRKALSMLVAAGASAEVVERFREAIRKKTASGRG